MSEQKTNFMASLDEWTGENVIRPLYEAVKDDWHPVILEVQKAIRAKVLESYRNGQTAGPRKASPQRRTYGV